VSLTHPISYPRLQPLKPGEKRAWESWEDIWVIGMTSAFVLYGIAFYFKPVHNMEDWARNEALRRMAVKAAAEDDEAEDEEDEEE